MRGIPDARLRVLASVAVAAMLFASVLVGCARLSAGTVATTASCGPAWVTGWLAAQQSVPGDQLAGRTLRMRVHVEVPGDRIRLRLSNRDGTGPLVIGRATVAPAGPAPTAATAGTPVTVPFAGRDDVTIPPGAQTWSDPVPMPGTELAVSLFLTVVPQRISSHPVAMQTAHLSGPGDATGVGDGGDWSTTLESWPVLRGVDVHTDRPAAAVVVVGDSIVDGVGGTTDGDDRLTDVLAARLRAADGERAMTVLNAGLSRNQLTRDDPRDGGLTPLARFDTDVAAAAGVHDVLLQAGTNDIGSGAGAAVIVDGMVRFADRVRAAGLRVLLSTIPPATVGDRGTPQGRAVRDQVNAWVREHGREHADGIVDLAAAVADPADPGRLRADLDSGDGLHPSPAGYRALADAVDPATLTATPCTR